MNLPPNGLPVEFMTRSWLLIPPLEEAAIAAGLKSGADILAFDLAAVPSARRPITAEALVRILAESAGALNTPGNPALFFQLPEPDDTTDQMLEVLVPARPQGILFSPVDPRDVQEMDVLLSVHEAMNAIEDGSIRLACLLSHAWRMDFAGLSRRLIALGWDAEAHRAATGARRMVDGRGLLTDSFRLARASVLVAAADAALEVIDGASGLWSPDRLTRDAKEAADDGFTGKFALSPRQVAAINHGFLPDEMDVMEARALINQDEIVDIRRQLRATRTLRRATPEPSRT